MSFPISAFRPESLSVVKLMLDDGNGKSASATGFYVKFGGDYYLVTAKHALLGLSGYAPEHYARRKWIPRYISTNCFRFSGKVLENFAVNEALYNANNEPRWRENPIWDVAVINLTETILSNEFSPIAMDISEVSVSLDENGTAESVSADLDLPSVAEEIFVVGYPNGVSILPQGSFPVWKRGSVATEPHMSLDGGPIYLIDMLGREGLSGAPVLYRGNSLVGPTGERREITDSRDVFRVVGVYVGREGITDGDHLSLGRAYKLSAIQDTIFAVS